MIALLGNSPMELLEREEKWANVPWKCSFPNPQDKPSWTAREFFGGPFFDSEGMRGRHRVCSLFCRRSSGGAETSG